MAASAQDLLFCSPSCKHNRLGEEAGCMILCANCETWFHKVCLCISPGSKILGLWVCPACDGVLHTHGKLIQNLELRLQNMETVLKEHTSSLLDLNSQLQSLSSKQIPIGNDLPQGCPLLEPSYASKLSSGLPMDNHKPPPQVQTDNQLLQDPPRNVQQKTPAPKKNPKPQTNVLKGTKKQDSPLTTKIPTEVFHVSYLSKATSPTMLTTYCETKGLKVVAVEETSKHRKLPWRCFRLRIGCSGKEDILRPTLWPSGTTCSLSVYRKQRDTSEIWGTDSSIEALGLSYSPMCEVYVGNCSLEADVSHLQTWLTDGGLCNAKVTALPVSPRSRSRSFRVTSSHSDSATLLDATFWPDGVVFRGFRSQPDSARPVLFTREPEQSSDVTA